MPVLYWLKLIYINVTAFYATFNRRTRGLLAMANIALPRCHVSAVAWLKQLADAPIGVRKPLKPVKLRA